MAATQIGDVVVPEVFLPYLIEKTAEKSELIQSGIMSTGSDLDARVTNGGRQIDMPFWQDLAGDDETITTGGVLDVNPITTEKDVARKMERGKAWGANDLAGLLAGDDPMAAIASLIADFKARKLQQTLLSTLTGIFGSASMASNYLAIHQTSGSANSSHMLTGTTFIDATQLMGDQKDRLAAVMMHSAVESHLKKLDLIDYLPDSQGGAPIRIFQGKRVIVDDSLTPITVDSKPVYDTYLFGAGAIGYGHGNHDENVGGGFGTWQLEFGRVGLAGESWLAHRWRIIMHPRGVAWQEDTVTGDSPSNADLEVSDNWERVYEPKNVRIVKLRHNIAA
jgi:hypothetical protein